MKWLDRLLGRPTPASEREQDRRALDDLHESFDRMQSRSERLVQELRRLERAPWKRS